MLVRLLYEWLSLGSDEKAQKRWCSRNGVVRARVRQMAATADLLAARIARFRDVPPKLLAMRWGFESEEGEEGEGKEGGTADGGAREGGEELHEDKVTLLRVLLLWCYWDQVAISSPQGRAKGAEARRVGVLGAPISATQLEAAAFFNPTGLGPGISMDPTQPPIPLNWRLVGTTSKTYVASGVDGRGESVCGGRGGHSVVSALRSWPTTGFSQSAPRCPERTYARCV